MEGCEMLIAKLKSLALSGSILFLMGGCFGIAAYSQSSQKLDDGHGSYTTKHYRNLFAEQGHTQPEIDARIEAAYQQLFHGDKSSQTVYYEAGRDENGALAYLTDVANHDARTEGMSYGMMIAVQTNHKAEFDALWNWANRYMLITDERNPSQGYFAWSMKTDGSANSDSPAPDGEEYFIMSLFFADHRWGSGKGIYDYKAQALRLLHLMRHHAELSGVGPFRVKKEDAADFHSHSATLAERKDVPTEIVGPMMNEAAKMVVFVPGKWGRTYTDPSYHLPAFYELWARWGDAADRDFWLEAAAASRSFFSKAANAQTGLVSDYTEFDGTPKAVAFNPGSATFSYDSWRAISNWSVDSAWWSKNPSAAELSDRVQSFLLKEGLHSFADRYTVEGKPLSNRHSTGMVATAAVGGLAAKNNAVAKQFVEELWATPVPSGEQRYYDGMLYLMSFLHASGEFRIW